MIKINPHRLMVGASLLLLSCSGSGPKTSTNDAPQNPKTPLACYNIDLLCLTRLKRRRRVRRQLRLVLSRLARTQKTMSVPRSTTKAMTWSRPLMSSDSPALILRTEVAISCISAKEWTAKELGKAIEDITSSTSSVRS